MNINILTLFGFQIVILIMSVVIHEVAHGVSALWQGDSTAKHAGRLTLNPLKHLDWWGSLLVPVIMILTLGVGFGWAKPVPYNPYNLRDQKRGPALVGLAGPVSNIILALVFGLAGRFLFLDSNIKEGIITNLTNYNQLSVLISGSIGAVFFTLFMMIVLVNVILAFFNLIPIPPLDGSKLLFSILPIKDSTKGMLEQFGFVFLLIFIFVFSGTLGVFLNWVLRNFLAVVVGV